MTCRIKAIHGPAGMMESAFHPMSVMLELNPPLAIRRGDMLARPHNQPAAATELEVLLCWLSDRPMEPDLSYILRHTSLETNCQIKELRYKLDVITLHRSADRLPMRMNDLARVALHTTTPVYGDSYRKNRHTGSLLLVDERTNATVAAGILL